MADVPHENKLVSEATNLSRSLYKQVPTIMKQLSVVAVAKLFQASTHNGSLLS